MTWWMCALISALATLATAMLAALMVAGALLTLAS
jgi:hypothetical protein